ncbi:MAG: hypothetical protein J7527_12010 [Chitinophagaceae bacterium]|nr:hypothetical protein [Chitinophagaceae bacterium]
MIKELFLAACMLITLSVFSQDSLKIARIDSLVNYYNNAGFKAERDSVINTMPEVKISTRTYLTVLIHDGAIKKYESRPTITRENNGVPETATGYNIFYFEKDKLIKVEEGMNDLKQSFSIDWYFENDAAFFCKTIPEKEGALDKLQERGPLLVQMANAMLEKMAPLLRK